MNDKPKELKEHSAQIFEFGCMERPVYLKEDVDAVVAELKADYKEACDRLQTTNLIKDEQKAKADKLLSCLKCLVMRDLIKDCPAKEVATEIIKEYDNGLG